MRERINGDGGSGNQLIYENGNFPISFNGTLNLNQINIYNSCGPVQPDAPFVAQSHLQPRNS